jgi:hypothetical protein
MNEFDTLREYIETKFRLQKLDSALLFFSSSLSLAFGIGYAYLGTRWLQYYLPMLFLGWFMPVYIGYVRGSLIKDSVEERIRGWLYFTVGLSIYIAFPLLSMIVDSLKLDYILTLLASAILGFAVNFLLGYYSVSVIVHKLFKIHPKDIRKEVHKAFRSTVWSALVLAVLVSLVAHIDWSKVYTSTVDIAIFVTLIMICLSAISEEWDARKLLESVKK